MHCFLARSFLLGAVIGMLPGCGQRSATVISTPTAAQVSQFVRQANLTLPASAQATGWQEERGMDNARWLQVRMPKPDLQGFLDRSPFRGAELTTNNQYLISAFREFLPKPPARYRAGQQSLPNARTLNMVIDETEPAKVVVYLMWHET